MIKKLAGDAISSLSVAPAILALVLLQFAFIVGSGYLSYLRDSHTDRRFQLLLQYCLKLPANKED